MSTRLISDRARGMFVYGMAKVETTRSTLESEKGRDSARQHRKWRSGYRRLAMRSDSRLMSTPMTESCASRPALLRGTPIPQPTSIMRTMRAA